jgi:hypothetical protein
VLSNVFEKVAALLRRQSFDQLLFRGRQDSTQSNHEQIADQERLNILGTSSHKFLFKASHALANGGLNFALCLHANLNVHNGVKPESARSNAAEFFGLPATEFHDILRRA